VEPALGLGPADGLENRPDGLTVTIHVLEPGESDSLIVLAVEAPLLIESDRPCELL